MLTFISRKNMVIEENTGATDAQSKNAAKKAAAKEAKLAKVNKKTKNLLCKRSENIKVHVKNVFFFSF
jgi:hypothetical protein